MTRFGRFWNALEDKTVHKHDASADKAREIARSVMRKEEPHQESTTDRIDRVVAHPLFGILIFAFVMVLTFTLSQTFVGPFVSDLLMEGFGWLAGLIETLMVSLDTSDFLTGLVLEGIIGGFAAVIGFLPLIMVLFFLLQLLEDSGYMSRVAIVMDRYFRRIGLAGKSIIPMYVGTACSIPAVMATRTIKNDRQRKLTILLTPFVPCGAKLPVIALFITVFFAGSGWVTALTYFLAILVIFLAGTVMRFILDVKGHERGIDQFHFIELPDYQRPSLKTALRVMADRGWEFAKKAGTIIILMNGLVWLASNFDWSLAAVASPDQSILKSLASPFAFLLVPLGFGLWGLAAAAILGMVAKEEVVGALAVIFAFGVTADFELTSVSQTREILMAAGGLTAASAYAYMAFNLFTPPCFAAIGAMRTELGSRKLTVLAVLFQLVVGYVVAMVIYQVGTLVFSGTTGDGFLAASIILGLIAVAFAAIRLSRRKVAVHG
jgi:ferrous iron transport protein B